MKFATQLVGSDHRSAAKRQQPQRSEKVSGSKAATTKPWVGSPKVGRNALYYYYYYYYKAFRLTFGEPTQGLVVAALLPLTIALRCGCCLLAALR